MSDHTYGITELSGISATVVDDAIKNGVRCGKTGLPIWTGSRRLRRAAIWPAARQPRSR